MDKTYTEAEIEAIREKVYNDGAVDTLDYLEGVYGEGIHETDLWAEYMGACECHTNEEEEE
jgi:hypothetical protein